jgi:hypothetical protein
MPQILVLNRLMTGSLKNSYHKVDGLLGSIVRSTFSPLDIAAWHIQNLDVEPIQQQQ